MSLHLKGTHYMIRFSFVLVLLLVVSPLCAQPRTETTKSQTIDEKVAGMQKFPGYFPFYWDAKAGKLWLEIDKWNTEFLYVESLPAGIGSNDIGLDRGQLGNSFIVRFDRSGPKVLLVAPNYDFRAVTNDPDEKLAVKMHLPSRLCGALKWQPKNQVVFLSMPPLFIFAMYIM